MFAKKSLGQNFLMHRQTAERIVEAARLPEGATALEIGPGTGMLTKALLAKGAEVIAVEADDSLVETLKEAFAEEIRDARLNLIRADIRNFDTNALPDGYRLIANIPYYITGEIIRTFLTAKNKPASMTLLVQKEVAERIARERKGSLLSLSVKAYGNPAYCFTVPRGAFNPAPNVDSAVLHIADIRSPFASEREEKRFFEVLRAGFAHKRKRLAGNLGEVASKEAVTQAFSAAGLDMNARAEDVALETWKALVRGLGN
ncbi:MAG TPA: 16S rRNA (adenine(1518)-N(6)/adenine(1519)-N(6))-dimethyltransferase RsmA [Candidatus Paceibacterota bacterium]|nr:16S rRNA (adenine(1518)-N(6)/adenine(1519)-N(6))-dimethyltransferase RsmA [Candidatus Paceibacterota bacterium]